MSLKSQNHHIKCLYQRDRDSGFGNRNSKRKGNSNSGLTHVKLNLHYSDY